jgi:hypothetical protein
MLALVFLLVGDPMWAVTIDGQFDYRPSNDQQLGFGFGIGGRRHELSLGNLSLWAGMDVFYDQFSSTVHVMSDQGSYDDAAKLTSESFLPMQVFRFESGLLSIEVGGGGGLAVVHYSAPSNGTTTLEMNLSEWDFAVRGVAAAAYQFWHDTAIELRFAYTHTYLSTALPNAPDLYSIGLGGVYRF